MKQPAEPELLREASANAERELIVLSAPDELPPVLAGHATPQVRARTESFYAASPSCSSAGSRPA
jgi:hypothetical protein